MPTSDKRTSSTRTTSCIVNGLRCLRSQTLSKKLKMSYDDRLNVSRKLFNLSRNRVESLKRNQSVKRCKSIEKPVDNSWITSGKVGSRDAVLVFRTNILNQNSHNLPSEEPSTVPIDSTNVKSNIEKSKNDCSSSSHPEISNIIDASMPSTSKRRQQNSPSQLNHKNVSTKKFDKKSDFAVVRKSRKNNENLGLKHKSLISTRMQLHDLLCSSSESSLSSDCYDIAEETEQQSVRNKTVGDDLNEGETGNCEDNEDAMNFDDISEDRPYSSNMPALNLKIYYKFMQTETKLLRKIFLRHGLSEVQHDENFSILWTGVHMKPDILRNLAPYQRVNHFPRSYELTRKDRLYKNIERMQHLRGMKYFDIVPQSFILPLEYRALVSAHNKSRGPWIVKPAASSRGRGIFIVNTPDQIPQDEQGLVSKYVANPLCIDEHKCDLRVYVLVTSFDPLLIYIYEEGLVRLATVKYDRTADNLWNPCMHLCNYSINKYHSDYIKSSDAHDEDVGHKWTLSALLRHLKSQGCDTRQLMSNIEDLIIKSILACAQTIIAACRMFVPSGNNCFELYGFDILIDDTLKPWLLEINLSPSMGVDTPLDAKVKSCLITDVLTCIGIPAYSSTMRAHYDSKWTRYRNISSVRRSHSADLVSSHNHGAARRLGVNGGMPVSSPPLTSEEQRIVRNSRLQNARRGGFVRIFPTEDTMQRYGTFMDTATGIPMSTPSMQGHMCYAMPHNYNQMLFNNLYGKDAREYGYKEENSQADRMSQYERALVSASHIIFSTKTVGPKCEKERARLRNQVVQLIDTGSELTQLQARQTFSLYLETILRRLTMEQRDYHEKLILKFLNRVGSSIKAPVLFRDPQKCVVISKARSAMVVKLMADFLEQYNRDTEAYVDAFDLFGMIPTSLYNEYLSQALEADLEYVLTLHTNLTSTMPFLYNRCGLSVPPTPPIPSGAHGFLKALPAMVTSGSGARDFNKYDSYYRSSDKDLSASKSTEALPMISNKRRGLLKML